MDIVKNLKLPEWLKRKETGEGAGDEDGIMAPGEVPEKVLNVSYLTIWLSLTKEYMISLHAFHVICLR